MIAYTMSKEKVRKAKSLEEEISTEALLNILRKQLSKEDISNRISDELKKDPHLVNQFFEWTGWKCTLLHYACYNRRLHSVKVLLDYGADTSLKIECQGQFNGKTAEEVALIRGYNEIVSLIQDSREKEDMIEWRNKQHHYKKQLHEKDRLLKDSKLKCRNLTDKVKKLEEELAEKIALINHMKQEPKYNLKLSLEYENKVFKKNLQFSSITDLETQVANIFKLEEVELSYQDEEGIIVLDDVSDLFQPPKLIVKSRHPKTVERRSSHITFPELSWEIDASKRFSHSTLDSGELFEEISQLFVPLKDKYTISKVRMIKNDSLIHAFDNKVSSIDFVRGEGELFNKTIKDDGEKLEILEHLKSLFDKQLRGSLGHANIVKVWHGCNPSACYSICKGGVKDLRKNDGGWFGSGIYLTPEIEYAMRYSIGGYGFGPITEPTPDDEYTVLLCYAVVGLAYPISRATDYQYPDNYEPWSISNFHYASPLPESAVKKAIEGDLSEIKEVLSTIRSDKAIVNGFDSHFVCVSGQTNCQATTADKAQYHELIVKEETQVLPVAVVYFKKVEHVVLKRKPSFNTLVT